MCPIAVGGFTRLSCNRIRLTRGIGTWLAVRMPLYSFSGTAFILHYLGALSRQENAVSFDYANPVMMKLRRVGQQLGVLRPMVKMYRRTFNVSYEEKFDREILRRIAPGDVVWDVGANVGYFTRKFSEKVGNSGRVLAFEPSPSTFAILGSECLKLSNVELVNVALADRDDVAQFHESGAAGDPTNGLDRPRPAGVSTAAVEVRVRRGDTLCTERPEVLPTRIKIDVEGYEFEVLRGLSETLRSPRVRDLFIEVHFGVLASRGLNTAPAEITKLLTECGFRLKWVDPSHLVASRED